MMSDAYLVYVPFLQPNQFLMLISIIVFTKYYIFILFVFLPRLYNS